MKYELKSGSEMDKDTKNGLAKLSGPKKKRNWREYAHSGIRWGPLGQFFTEIFVFLSEEKRILRAQTRHRNSEKFLQ